MMIEELIEFQKIQIINIYFFLLDKEIFCDCQIFYFEITGNISFEIYRVQSSVFSMP